MRNGRRYVLAVAVSALLGLAAVIFLRFGGDRTTDLAGKPAAEARERIAASADLAAPGTVAPEEATAQLAERRPLEAPDVDPKRKRPKQPTPLEPFRGLLLDVATDEPIARAHLVAGRLDAETGADGRWRSDAELPDSVEQLEFHDRHSGTHIRTVSRSALLPDIDEGWIARIAIGPTFRLVVQGAGAFEPEGWSARLVEVHRDGRESAGSWTRLRDTDPTWFRYDNPWEPNEDGSSFRVDVRSSDGTQAGSSSELRSAVGIYPEIVVVHADARLAALTGRVIDTSGDPKKSATVTLARIGAAFEGDAAEPRYSTRSEGDGTFVLGAISPGEYDLVVRPRRGEAPHRQRLLLDPGMTRLPDIIVDRQVGVGMIEGLLKSADGRRLASPEVVRLRAVDGRSFELFDVSSPQGRRGYYRPNGLGIGGSDPTNHGFEFNEVPAGEYELSVVSQQGYAWTPASVRVTAPDDKAVFTRLDAVVHGRYRFRVLDAESEAPIEPFYVQRQAGARWTAEADEWRASSSFVAPEASFEWTVSAPGYAAARGTQADFQAEGEDRVATVLLERGYDVRLLFRELTAGFGLDDDDGLVAAMERPPLDGVRVLADGALVATSVGGEATVRLARAPQRLEVRADGFRPVESQRFRGGRIQGPERDVIVWMVRE
ncbi:MAG: carboxypeptidase-like regulatory domain-containing protein [Planctomycetota bacterium]